MKVLNIGHNNFVMADKIVAVVSPQSSPIKRLIANSKKNGNLIDATLGHKTRSVIVTEGGQVILSALNTDSITERIKKERL